jgi:hypothetical protein
MKNLKQRLFRAAILGLFFGIIICAHALALTPEQVITLKKAGVSDRTIQLMIEQERNGQQNPYDSIGTREVTDSAGNRYVIQSTGKSDQNWDAAEKEKVDKAWQMLQSTIIDGRPK